MYVMSILFMLISCDIWEKITTLNAIHKMIHCSTSQAFFSFESVREEKYNQLCILLYYNYTGKCKEGEKYLELGTATTNPKI